MPTGDETFPGTLEVNPIVADEPSKIAVGLGGRGYGESQSALAGTRWTSDQNSRLADHDGIGVNIATDSVTARIELRHFRHLAFGK